MSIWVLVITLFAIGIVAAGKKIEELVPASKDLVKFLTQSQGWVGLVSIFMGLFWVIKALRWIKYFNFNLFVMLVSAIVLIILGFVLSQSTLKTWAVNSKGASDFIDKVVGVFTPHTMVLGLVALGLGVFQLIRAI